MFERFAKFGPIDAEDHFCVPRRQLGLVSWFGELLTKKFNTEPDQPNGEGSAGDGGDD